MGRCSYYKNTVYITAIDHHNTCISTCITYTHFYQLYQCPYALSQYRCKEYILKKLSQKSHTGFLTISKGLTTLQEAPVFSMTQIEWGWGEEFPHTMDAPHPALPTNMLLMNDQRSRSMSYTSALRSL